MNEGPAYVYTVYLFSTRDEDVALETNRKLLKAGHDTQIIESTANSVKRYRVAATGFDSSQAAKKFLRFSRRKIRRNWNLDRPGPQIAGY